MRLKQTILVPVILLLLSACTPSEMALFQAWVSSHPNTCDAQVDAQWPSNSRAWAHRIVYRESRGIATAQNAHSTAAGCFQLLIIHAWRFRAVGYSWADRYNARANVAAALNLYREAGTSPWA